MSWRSWKVFLVVQGSRFTRSRYAGKVRISSSVPRNVDLSKISVKALSIGLLQMGKGGWFSTVASRSAETDPHP
jgi:hypothetical protein